MDDQFQIKNCRLLARCIERLQIVAGSYRKLGYVVFMINALHVPSIQHGTGGVYDSWTLRHQMCRFIS